MPDGPEPSTVTLDRRPTGTTTPALDRSAVARGIATLDLVCVRVASSPITLDLDTATLDLGTAILDVDIVMPGRRGACRLARILRPGYRTVG